MTLNIKRSIVLLVAALVGVVFVTTAPHVFAAATSTSGDICNGLTLTGSTDCNNTTNLTSIVKKVVSVLSIAVGVTAVIFVIVGGFKFITSSGDAQKAASARNTVLYAVIGLAVAALAEFIVSFVLGNVTK